MGTEEQICFYCQHWAIDPGALDERHRIILKKLAGGEEWVPAGMYGKCQATFTDKAGVERRVDRGTLALTHCIAFDDEGNRLFEPVPID